MKIESMPRWRLVAIALLVVGCFYALGRKLYTLQVVESRSYAGAQVRQSVRRVLIPATRGRIFDRNGKCLADNRPSYCLAAFVEELRRPGRWSNTVNRVDEEIDKMAAALGIERRISRDEVNAHVHRRLPLPLLAWEDVDDTTLARFSETSHMFSGMDIYVKPERVYPYGDSAAHIIGYTGRDKPVSTNEFFHYNLDGLKGRSGIEAAMDDKLRGVPGGKLITVDVSGYRHAETNHPAIHGSDVYLTIDIDMQREFEKQLEGRRAAGVIVDPRNGEILAMASSPRFALNLIVPSVTSARWKSLVADEGRPLMNRAVVGMYPPGSIFKPVVALAALGKGVSRATTYPCNGYFAITPRAHLRCSARYGHGDAVDMRYAIEQSCNPFFCALGTAIGPDAIGEEARLFGFGERTGICLEGEGRGLVPSGEWKKKRMRDSWRAGDTANFSIGQGFTLVTPLQAAMYAAALANGGSLLAPKIVKDGGEAGVVRRRVPVRPGDMEFVRSAMRDVVYAERGSGRRARLEGFEFAAKTGTAEYGSRQNRRKHTWMIAFAPYENPTMAMAVVVEDGESGGLTVAPIIKAMVSYKFRDVLPPQSGDDEEKEAVL